MEVESISLQPDTDKEMTDESDPSAPERGNGIVWRLRRLADQIERGEMISYKWRFSSRTTVAEDPDFFDRGRLALVLLYSSSAKQEK